MNTGLSPEMTWLRWFENTNHCRPTKLWVDGPLYWSMRMRAEEIVMSDAVLLHPGMLPPVPLPALTLLTIAGIPVYSR